MMLRMAVGTRMAGTRCDAVVVEHDEGDDGEVVYAPYKIVSKGVRWLEARASM